MTAVLTPATMAGSTDLRHGFRPAPAALIAAEWLAVPAPRVLAAVFPLVFLVSPWPAGMFRRPRALAGDAAVAPGRPLRA